MANDNDRIKPKEAIGWLGFGIVAFGAYELLSALGVIPSFAEKQKEKQTKAALERFEQYKVYATKTGWTQIVTKYISDVGPVPSGKGVETINGPDETDKNLVIAKAILSAKGFIGDDEDRVYTALKAMRDLADMWMVQQWFVSTQVKGVGNFLTYIESFMKTEDEKVKIVYILDQMPFWYKGPKRKIKDAIKPELFM